ncbi:hypothetical protein AGDE_16115 [Angomonas deanei]|nr:hypothetical protein AGDE_16115 [Angomonas deanei]|eukprot:EPY17703.1 hypothetical protein AGDE_16115 [Angomonas deanei]
MQYSTTTFPDTVSEDIFVDDLSTTTRRRMLCTVYKCHTTYLQRAYADSPLGSAKVYSANRRERQMQESEEHLTVAQPEKKRFSFLSCFCATPKNKKKALKGVA